MAKITFNIDGYMRKMRAMGMNTEGICKYAIYDAAGAVVEAIKSAAPVKTGDMRDSVSLSDMRNDNGYINTKVMFVGYDRNGTPNALKANAIESGRSNMQKRPFIRPAVNRVKPQAQAMIERALDKKINEYMKEG